MFDWISPSLVLSSIIAVVGVVLAWRQWITNQRKLQSDLFERRHVFYKAARQLISRVLGTGKASHETTTKFLLDVEDARFVLNDELADYLENELYPKAVTLQALESELTEIGTGPERANIIRRQREIQNWFEEQNSILHKRFQPFLKLRH